MEWKNDENGVRRAYVRAWVLNDEQVVTEPCPFCGFCHYHGSCGGKNWAGGRASHCLESADVHDYNLVAQEGPVPPEIRLAMKRQPRLKRYPRMRRRR